MGKLIVMEGACDGIGKSTQYVLLKNKLEKEGYSVEGHHFPSYGETQGKLVEEYLKGNYGATNSLSPYLINSFYAADRGVTWYTHLKELYDNGSLLLLDRYTTSSLLYQSATIDDKNERNEFVKYVCDFEYNKIGIKEPDMVIFLHAPFDLVTKLREARKNNDGIEKDIYERNIELMRKIYYNSLDVASLLNWDFIECSDGEKMKPIEVINDDIMTRVKTKVLR